jgi:hypothetical protein
MDIGTSIVVCGAIVSIIGGTVCVIALFRPRTICALHNTMTNGQTELWEAIKEMREDIKVLLQRTVK